MSRIWPSLAHLLTRRVAATLLVCLAVTVALATGLSRLDFATGQDSYLNKDSEVAKDNVVYQTAFGGPAMLVLFTGDDVVDLFSPDNLSELKALEEDLRASGVVESVIGPYTALEFTAAQVEGGISSVAAQILLRALQAEPDPAAQQARQADLLLTNERLTAAGEPSLDNPAYVEFLIFDNKGNVREPLKPFFPDSSHGQMVVRLPGNASIEDEGTASDTVVDLVGDHGARPAARVPGPLAPAAARRGGGRRHLGLRPARPSRHPAVARDDLGPAHHRRDGRRLRHPRAQPGRGGDQRRARGLAFHAGHLRPRATAARRHHRRGAGRPGARAVEGPHDPGLRHHAGGRVGGALGGRHRADDVGPRLARAPQAERRHRGDHGGPHAAGAVRRAPRLAAAAPHAGPHRR